MATKTKLSDGEQMAKDKATITFVSLKKKEMKDSKYRKRFDNFYDLFLAHVRARFEVLRGRGATKRRGIIKTVRTARTRTGGWKFYRANI